MKYDRFVLTFHTRGNTILEVLLAAMATSLILIPPLFFYSGSVAYCHGNILDPYTAAIFVLEMSAFYVYSFYSNSLQTKYFNETNNNNP